MTVESLRWKGDRLEVLDQRLLPDRVEYLICRTAAEVAEAIRGMAVRGAPAIGCAAAFGIALEPKESSYDILARSRPTAVNLFWALERMRRAQDKREEAEAILGKLQPGLLIALDERGRSLDSEAFAGRIAAARDAGTAAATLVIGGADGLAEAIRERAGLTLAFGALTIPHQIVRALVLEQLYRTMTIIAGHPYHRA